jgi:hypothetical protein
MEMSQGKPKNVFFFSKTENRMAKQVLLGGWYKWERGGYKEKV